MIDLAIMKPIIDSILTPRPHPNLDNTISSISSTSTTITTIFEARVLAGIR